MVVNNIKKTNNRSVQVITEEEMLDKLDTKDNQMFVGVTKEEKFSAGQIFAIALLRHRDIPMYICRTNNEEVLLQIHNNGGYVWGKKIHRSDRSTYFNAKYPIIENLFFPGTYEKLNKRKLNILESIYNNIIDPKSLDIVTTIIQNFNTTWDEPQELQNLNFETAVHFACFILGAATKFTQIALHKDKHEKAHKKYAAFAECAIRKKHADKSYIILERKIDFKPYVQRYNKELKNNYVKKINFVIYPYENRSRWVVHAIEDMQLDPIIKHLEGFKYLTLDNMSAEFMLLDQCTNAINLTEAVLFDKNIHVDTQKMINTLRESQPDQTTRTFLKIIMEHNIKKE